MSTFRKIKRESKTSFFIKIEIFYKNANIHKNTVTMNIKTAPLTNPSHNGKINGYAFGGPNSAFEPFRRNSKQEDKSEAESVFKMRTERRTAFGKIRDLFHNNKVCCVTT